MVTARGFVEPLETKRQQPGGAGGDRTRDLLTASQARSQLRYSPKHSGCCRSPQFDAYRLLAFFRVVFLAVLLAGLRMRMLFFVAFFLFIAKADPPPSCHCKG